MNYLWYGIISVSGFLILLVCTLFIALLKNKTGSGYEQNGYIVSNCPTCGQMLDPGWNRCPFCNDEIRKPAPQFSQTNYSSDVPIGYLMVKSGSNRGQVFKVDIDMVTIGSNNDNQIIINDNRVSPQHVKIWLSDMKFFIQDLKSQNGTKVNNREVDQIELKDDDQIDVLGNLFTFKILEV